MKTLTYRFERNATSKNFDGQVFKVKEFIRDVAIRNGAQLTSRRDGDFQIMRLTCFTDECCDAVKCGTLNLPVAVTLFCNSLHSK